MFSHLPLLLLLLVTIVNYIVGSNLRLSNANSCDPNLPVQIRLTASDSIPQKLNFSINTPIDMDETLINNIEYHTLLPNGKHILLGRMIDKDGPCNWLMRYVAEVWKDIQRRLGAVPAKCPMRKGNYSMYNFVLDYTHLTNMNLPNTGILIKWAWTQKSTKLTMQCTNFYLKAV